MSAQVVSTGAERSRRAALNVGRPGVIWAIPGLVFFIFFAVLPLMAVAYLSFTDWSGLGAPQLTGFENWIQLVGDRVVLDSIGIMLLLLVLSVAAQLPLSILLGVWAAGPQRNRAVLAAIYFLPLLLSGAAIAIVWRQLMDPNFGFPSQLKHVFGGSGDFIGTPTGALVMLVVVATWQFTPFHTLLFQGSARSIPKELYQAAEIDGANRYQQFFSITLPQLRNTVITSLIFLIVGGLTAFETVLILTRGGPGRATTTTPLLMYLEGFQRYELGYGAAIALVLVILATAISIILTRMSGYDRMESTREGI